LAKLPKATAIAHARLPGVQPAVAVTAYAFVVAACRVSAVAVNAINIAATKSLMYIKKVIGKKTNKFIGEFLTCVFWLYHSFPPNLS
jgi:hypothetical protein